MEREKANDADKTKVTYVGAIVPVNAKVNVLANYSNIKNVDATVDDASAFALGVTYAFSKRTTAYAMYGQSSNDGSAAVGVTSLATTGAGQDQKATMAGIRHTF
jgi:predicted porin